MENTAHQALSLLRNRMTGDDMRSLPDADLHQLEAICHHWKIMAEAEIKARANTINNVFSGE